MLYLFFVLYHYKLNLEHCVSNDVTGPFGCEKLENQECSTSHLKVNHDRVFILANFSCQLTDRRLSENLTTNGLLLLHSILIRLACVLCHCSKPIECLQCVRVSSWKKKRAVFTTVALQFWKNTGVFCTFCISETPFKRDIEVSRKTRRSLRSRCAWKKDKM